jgi:membrane-associated protease RseP (regulator of RpoE activity)
LPIFDDPTSLTIAFLCGVSVLVAVFNLLPIPPLDGALLAGIAFEAVTGKAVSENIHARAHKIGNVALGVASTAALTWLAFAIWG